MKLVKTTLPLAILLLVACLLTRVLVPPLLDFLKTVTSDMAEPRAISNGNTAAIAQQAAAPTPPIKVQLDHNQLATALVTAMTTATKATTTWPSPSATIPPKASP